LLAAFVRHNLHEATGKVNAKGGSIHALTCTAAAEQHDCTAFGTRLDAVGLSMKCEMR